MEAVILAGIPGSGKTTFALERFFNTHVRLSLDQLKTRQKENILLHACLAAQQPFLIDNTNITAEARGTYLRLAKAAGFRCVLYYFETTTREAIGRNSVRPKGQRVPNPAILRSYKRQERPSSQEGFDAIYTVRVTPAGFEVKELS